MAPWHFCLVPLNPLLWAGRPRGQLTMVQPPGFWFQQCQGKILNPGSQKQMWQVEKRHPSRLGAEKNV